MTGTLIQALPHLAVSRRRELQIYLQLYQRYRDAIAGGTLRPGDRVPSMRSLASELNVARGTVELAYQMLTSEGYFQARGAAGTMVSSRLEARGTAPLGRAVRRSAACTSYRRRHTIDLPRPFQLGLPALDAFPSKVWARLAGRRTRSVDAAAMTYPDPAGYEPLRRAIAAHVGISRGIECAHENVFVTAGYRGTLELVCRTLLRAGDVGWYEDPGYLFGRQFLEHAGMRLAAVPVDEEGLNVAIGRQRAAHARFAIVTPTHQSPMGVALALPRRLELLKWAIQRQAWIIEDDYDSEFRYHGRPLPALKGLDSEGHVLYAGTFSKVLFPGLRLAYLVVPDRHVERFSATANHLAGPGSILLRATVADFMDQGHFARHLRKMRSLYAARRNYLTESLTQALGSQLHVQPQAGGIHVLAHLRNRRDDKALAAAAQSHGLAVQALSSWHMHRTSRAGLLMGFTNVVGPTMAAALTRELIAATGLLGSTRK